MREKIDGDVERKYLQIAEDRFEENGNVVGERVTFVFVVENPDD